MLAQPLRPIAAAIDPARVRRAAQDLQAPDVTGVARTLARVPDHLDEAIGDAGDALRETVARLPVALPVARRRRARPAAIPMVAALVGLAIVGVLVSLIYRARTPAAMRAASRRLDAEAIDRAAGEGMDGPAPGSATLAPGAGLFAEGVRPTTGLTAAGPQAEPVNRDPEGALASRP